MIRERISEDLKTDRVSMSFLINLLTFDKFALRLKCKLGMNN